jgi:histidinol-phosphatase
VTNSLKSDLELALSLADATSEIALSRFQSLDLKVETKPDRTPVTDADRAVESRIRELLAVARPEDAIIGEEFGSQSGNERTWIIDPIDGTANFLRGIPIWATLIGLRVGTELSVGVVNAPALGRRWWAMLGGGAFASDFTGRTRSLAVSKVGQLEDASISYNSLQLWERSGKLAGLMNLNRHAWRSRAIGDFWSYMLVAEGALDLSSEHDLKIYDIAALVPIVREAGGKFTDLVGELSQDSSSILVSNGILHEKARAILNQSA